MPLDSSSAPGKSAKISKRTTSRLSSLAEDAADLDAPFRAKLHSLFAQIEKEFEVLYLENLNCEYSN